MEWGRGGAIHRPRRRAPASFQNNLDFNSCCRPPVERLLGASASIRAGKPPEASALNAETEDEEDGNRPQRDSADSSDTVCADAASFLRKSKT